MQMLDVLKTKFFQDILSLDAGDRWEKKLYENIDRCDLFLLFWSQAAKDLQWVLKEAEYALAHQQKSPKVASPISCRSYWSKTCPRRQACPRSISTIGSPISFRSCPRPECGGGAPEIQAQVIARRLLEGGN